MSILFVTSGLLIIFQGMGQARNPSTLDSDRLAFHSSRISRTGPHARSLSLSLSHTHTHTPPNNDDHRVPPDLQQQ